MAKKKTIHPDVETFTEKLEASANIEILKAKVTKELTMEIMYNENISDDTINEVTKKCDNLVHEDLQAAFAALKPHMAIICDLREGYKMNPEKYDPEALINVEVTGISITGGESSGVVLIGKKHIGKKVLNLVSPFTKYDDEHDPYKYANDLNSLVEICVSEVQLYLEGKCASKQLAIDFDNNGEE